LLEAQNIKTVKSLDVIFDYAYKQLLRVFKSIFAKKATIIKPLVNE